MSKKVEPIYNDMNSEAYQSKEKITINVEEKDGDQTVEGLGEGSATDAHPDSTKIPLKKSQQGSQSKPLIVVIVAFILVAIIVGIIISVGGKPKCKEKYKIDDPTTNLTYRLSYCGREGQYCEQIMRFRNLNVISE